MLAKTHRPKRRTTVGQSGASARLSSGYAAKTAPTRAALAPTFSSSVGRKGEATLSSAAPKKLYTAISASSGALARLSSGGGAAASRGSARAAREASQPCVRPRDKPAEASAPPDGGARLHSGPGRATSGS